MELIKALVTAPASGSVAIAIAVSAAIIISTIS
jgi:hypothetical protein